MKGLALRQPIRSYIALILFILLGVVLRFYRISDMPLRADEAMTLFFAKDLATILRQVTTSDPHMPVYYFMLHGWLELSGSSELAERFPTLFASVLVIPLTFVLGRTVFPRERRVALVGALLTALNPFLIWDGQDAYIYAFLTALSLGSFILFLRAVQPNSTMMTWIKYVVVSVLDLFFHYFAGLILVAEGVVLFFLVGRRRVPIHKLLHGLMAGVAIAGLYAPWLVLALPVLTNFKTDFLLSANLLEMASRTLVSFTVGRYDSRIAPSMIDPVVGNILAMFFLMVFLVGWVAPMSARGRESNSNPLTLEGRLILTIYVGIPLAVVFLFSIWRFPIFDERFVLYLAPAFLLVVARGLNTLYGLPKTKFVAVAAAGFVVATSAYSLFNYWYVPAFAKSPDWRGFVEKIFSESQAGDVLIQNYPDPALPYYLKDHIPRVLLPRSSAQSASDLSADLARLTTRYTRVWFQPAPNSTWDTEGLVAMWLARHAREVHDYDVRGARLELYLTAAAALRDAKPVGATFDSRIQLIAFDLDQSKPLVVRLYWQTRQKPDRDYTVFVHLYSSDGRLVAQKDTTPVNGTFPTTQWEEDQTIVDLYEIAVPRDAPSGTYMLMAGMYDSQTLARLAVVDNQGRPLPENRVLLAKINLVSAIQTPMVQAQTLSEASAE